MLLQRFLRQATGNLRAAVIHCSLCKAAFVRGFFDSEGTSESGTLAVGNGDLDKLGLVRELLDSLGIMTTGPHLRLKSGGTKVIKGRVCNINKNQYSLYVRVGSRRKFRDFIGFAIRRKMLALDSQLLPKLVE